jgi:hypothetical protein
MSYSLTIFYICVTTEQNQIISWLNSLVIKDCHMQVEKEPPWLGVSRPFGTLEIETSNYISHALISINIYNMYLILVLIL